ncbi:MAG: GNAT family N-acetyltransferase [Flavobacteriales bacterium]|nr:GNAT family N-acetyltransferase [Flavobacteriales bacterium]
MNYRTGSTNDLDQLRELGLKSWSQYKGDLTEKNWNKLFASLDNYDTYLELLEKSDCIVCENDTKEIIGMAFLVPSGNPNEIYDAAWCHLRFVSVDPKYRGNSIGKKLTEQCIDLAIKNDEKVMALHTSEIMKNARHIYEQIGFKVLKEINPRLGVKYWLYTLELNN